MRREFRDSRQAVDGQRAFDFTVGGQGANDIQTVFPESAYVRNQCGGERDLDSHSDPGAADRERVIAGLVLVLAVEHPESGGNVGRQRGGRSVKEIVARAVIVVKLCEAGGLIMQYSLGQRAPAPPDKRNR